MFAQECSWIYDSEKAQELGYLAKSNPDQREIEDEDFGDSIYIKLISALKEKQIQEELADIIDVEQVIIHVEDYKVEEKAVVEQQEAKSLVDSIKTERWIGQYPGFTYC